LGLFGLLWLAHLDSLAEFVLRTLAENARAVKMGVAHVSRSGSVCIYNLLAQFAL